jgi:hypothetical protein
MDERKYKLSEAMIKGCELSGQVFNKLADAKGRTCALGAAYVGSFEDIPKGPYFVEAIAKLRDAYPELRESISVDSAMIKDLPEDIKTKMRIIGDSTVNLQEFIVRLNDFAKKTREEIAVILERAGY